MAFSFGKGGNSFSQRIKTSQEISGLKNKIKAEQKKIESYYTNLGKVYYETCRDEAHPETQELIGLIRNSFAAIDGFNEQIAAIEAVKCCPKCGTPIEEGAVFCTGCGVRLSDVLQPEEPEAPAEEEPAFKFCVSCGEKLPAAAMFCTKCGAKQEG